MNPLKRLRIWSAIRNLRMPDKQERAIERLVEMGQAAIEPLRDARDNTDSPYVREGVAKALRQILGESIARSSLRLVYPVYLDTPMMTGLLASLEGGLVQETDLERRSQDARETESSGTLTGRASGLLSGILNAEAGAGLASKVSESLESHYKSTVRFPNATLFITLRNLLLQQGYIKVLTSKTDLSNLAVGDIVEFEGRATPDPAYQIRRMFGQLLPVVESVTGVQIAQIDEKIAALDATRPGSQIEIGGESITVQNKKHATSLQAVLTAQEKGLQAESNVNKQIGRVLTDLFPEENMSNVLFLASDFKAVGRVYPAFARNEKIDEIYDAHWKCLGKVLDLVPASDEYDFLKGSPISYFAREQYSEIMTPLQAEELSIQPTEPVVSGPLVIIAALAVFI